MKIRVKVPATTANLGPGFDVLGMALDLENTFYFEDSDDFSPDDLILRSYLYTYKDMCKNPHPVTINQEALIPRNGGLGSSSSCIVAGIVAALVRMGHNDIDNDLVLSLATKIEGHPDNVAPAILGGLVASKLEEDQVDYIRYPVSQSLRFYLILPDFQVDTKDARGVLPDSISLEDGIKNLSSILFLLRGLEKGDMDLIKKGVQDTFHQPYRKTLIPSYDQIQELVQSKTGAFYLSGSGSTMMAISSKDVDLSIDLKKYLADHYPLYRLEETRVKDTGYQVDIY